MNPFSDLLYRRLFKATPCKILVLRPGSYEIIAVTDAYLQATLTSENEILGKSLFDVFPDNPRDQQSDSVRNLSASLRRVQILKTQDIMGVQRYPIRCADGSFEERFWSSVNSPVLGNAGDIEFIMHKVEDVTAIVRKYAEPDPPDVSDRSDTNVIQDLILRSQELRLALSKLQEHEARLRTAERLLNLGGWELDIQTSQLSWSEQVFEIYDIPATQTAPDIADYFARVHPDDRKASLAIYTAFAEQLAPRIEFEHRILTRDGEIRYIKGGGERRTLPDGEIVVGYVQDITSLIQAQHKLSQAERLLRLAGEKSLLGGWRVELDTGASIWTPETAIIHDMTADYSPGSVAEAIQFYMPEYRDLIQNAFERCAQQGEAFDLICRLQTPQGRKPWVRAIGEAERNGRGQVIAVQGAFQDISPLQEARIQADEEARQRISLLESISDAFFALDENWNFTYLNQRAGLLLERVRVELIGKNLWQEFPQAVGSEFENQYRLAMLSQQTSSFQSFYMPLGKWFDVSAYPIPDGLAVYFRDVTEEKRHQEQLRLVNAALARQNDIVMITTADTLDEPHGPRIVYVNDAFERVTGYSKSDAIGKTPRLLQGADSSRQQLGRIRQALQNKQPIRCEVLNYTKEGASYWLELDITPLFDEAGQCTHFVAVERDITERKQQEAEFRQAQERFQLISRATNDVIWDWDLISDGVWWNAAMTEVFGHAISELEPGSESWINRIHPDDLDCVVTSIHQVIDGDEERWSADYRFLKNSHQYAHVVDRGFVIRDASGKAIRMLGSMQDVTERIELEQRLRMSQKLEAVGHLTGGVAHDFNNLLTVILGNAEMLAELSTDDKLRSMAEMTLSAAQRGAELTNRLLAFARRQPLNPKPTDLNQLMEAMRALIRRTLPENIELELVPAPGLGLTEIDSNELDTALLNLVVNGRDAMPDGGILTIETDNAVLDSHYADLHPGIVPGEYVMICVSDTGVGMDSDTIHRAFEPFFTTKAVGKGSGLGLSMVFGFTKQSGGHIKIYSEPGEGTSVKLYFPRAQGVELSSDHPTTESKPQGGAEHILIAEDDGLVRQHLEGQLCSLGYRVTTATSGPEAMEVLKANNDIDLLLTDIIMPGGMNGRELADWARASYPFLKVLFTSGYTENAIVHHGRLDPGVELLSKPYTRLELATKVRRALQRLGT